MKSLRALSLLVNRDDLLALRAAERVSLAAATVAVVAAAEAHDGSHQSGQYWENGTLTQRGIWEMSTRQQALSEAVITRQRCVLRILELSHHADDFEPDYGALEASIRPYRDRIELRPRVAPTDGPTLDMIAVSRPTAGHDRRRRRTARAVRRRRT